MDFKGLDVSNIDRIHITEKYGISNAEAARARVGLRLLNREDLSECVPIHATIEGGDSWSSREAAEAVVAGNLALLHNVVVDPSQERLQAAKITVESGLAALEVGAEEAAKRFNEEFEANRK